MRPPSEAGFPGCRLALARVMAKPQAARGAVRCGSRTARAPAEGMESEGGGEGGAPRGVLRAVRMRKAVVLVVRPPGRGLAVRDVALRAR